MYPLIKGHKAASLPLRQYLREASSGDRDLHTFQSLLSFPLQVVPEISRSRNVRLPLGLNGEDFDKRLMTLNRAEPCYLCR